MRERESLKIEPNLDTSPRCSPRYARLGLQPGRRRREEIATGALPSRNLVKAYLGRVQKNLKFIKGETVGPIKVFFGPFLIDRYDRPDLCCQAKFLLKPKNDGCFPSW